MKWDVASGNQIPMGIADMDFRAAPVIIEALRQRLDHGVFGYTDKTPALPEAVCEWTSARRGWDLDSTWVTTCSGVMPSIAHVLRSALQPGDGVIVHTPAFRPIVEAVLSNGLQVVENALQLVDGRYEIDFDALRVAASGSDTKAFILCSPHNPSGRVWSKSELEEIAQIARECDLIVISDEIHCEIVFPWAHFTTYAHVAHAGDRFVVCFGPSKGFNLATLRMSVTAIPHDELREGFRRELETVNADFGVNALGAVTMQAAYSSGGPWLDALASYLERNLDTLTLGLGELPKVRVVLPDASFLVWLDCREAELSDDELRRRFEDIAEVVVEPGISFGPSGSGFVRINIGTTNARVAEATERIAAIATSW
ncbi:MAG: putative C-S lyase [Actinomycetia bacterium]|nr:putative C-S lyase [Actinomycetes bacterium]